MRNLNLCILILLFAGLDCSLSAQPQYYNYNTAGAANSFPFNITSGKEVQLLFLPGDFNQPTPAPAGYITSVSFRIHDLYALGPWTYSELTIKMGQSDLTSFVAGSFYAGALTTVYYRASIVLAGAAGGWMTIILDSPFAYDPAHSLIMDIGQCGVSGATGFSSCFTALTGERRLWSAGGCPFAYAGSNTAVYHMGLDIDTSPTLFDNGPLVNSIGTGADWSNENIYYQGGTATYGLGCQYTSGIYVADDFTVPPGKSWAVTSMNFYSYQTGSTTTSTITGLYVRIWNGKPGVAGSTVVWGNMNTNRMESTSFAYAYRVLAANGGVDRPIMKVVAGTPGLGLNAGSYWVEWACSGSLASGPWLPPVVTADMVTGNAIQTINLGVSYTDIVFNAYSQGFPFVLKGTEIVNPFMIIQNVTIPYAQINCFNATQTILVAGNGTPFLVENGGSATMIAGQNILYNPGTVVQAGGYLWGYIAPNGPFCTTPPMPAVAVSSTPSGVVSEMTPGVMNEMEISKVSGQSSFTIYPNPTAGNFTLVLTGGVPTDGVIADIYGIRGEKVLTGVLTGERRHEFSLTGLPAGIYVIRVINGDKAEAAMVIKQ